MSSRRLVLYGLAGLTFVVSLFLMGVAYNSIVSKEEEVARTWSNVESNYQRRANLIPGLVNTVRAGARQEHDTLVAVTEARASALRFQASEEDLTDPAAVARMQQAEAELILATRHLFVRAERYPEIRSNQLFLRLQDQLAGTENRIMIARRRYNEAVQKFNTDIRTFPGVIANALFLHRQPKTPYEAQAGADQAPQARFR